jgi:hypothetical protein
MTKEKKNMPWAYNQLQSQPQAASGNADEDVDVGKLAQSQRQ